MKIDEFHCFLGCVRPPLLKPSSLSGPTVRIDSECDSIVDLTIPDGTLFRVRVRELILRNVCQNTSEKLSDIDIFRLDPHQYVDLAKVR